MPDISVDSVQPTADTNRFRRRNRRTIPAAETAEALAYFHTEYPDWKVAERFHMWDWGQLAFAQDDGFAHFKPLYDRLRGPWHAFRSSKPGPRLSCDETFELLKVMSQTHPRLHTLGLTDLSSEDVPELRALWQQTGRIKTNQNGPSLVAMTKFLHFWNPRLFVIVDVQEMQRKGLNPQQVRLPLRRLKAEIETRYGRASRASDPTTESDQSYSAILLWSSQLVRDNPSILTHFANYIGMHSNGRRLPDEGRYEDCAGAAAEMFLLGWAQHLAAEGQA